MTRYKRETHVDAPLETVWDFHADVAGLEALSPPWMHLRVESIVGPDGEPDPTALDPGSTVTMSMRLFGIGRRKTWTARIVARERGSDRASFEDVQLEGPFARWHHTHAFVAEGDGTRIVDRVAYSLADVPLGNVLDGFAWPGLEATFRARHARTKALLEADAE